MTKRIQTQATWFQRLLSARTPISLISPGKMENHIGEPGWLSWLSIQLLTSAWVMISRFVRSSPTSGSVLTAWSLLGILSPSLSLSLSLCPFPTHYLSQKNRLKKNKILYFKMFHGVTNTAYTNHPHIKSPMPIKCNFKNIKANADFQI